jgi:hypothetical protein
MAIALSPILRFGPGGDFLSDVFADRLESSAPIAAGESGDFDPGASSGSPGHPGGEGAQARSRGGRSEDVFQSDGSSALVGSHQVAGGAPGPDGLELSTLARRAGGLLVAQRLLAVHSLTLWAAASLVTSMLATIQRVSEPVRTLRHPADRPGQSAVPTSDPAPIRSSPRPAVSSRVPSLFASHAADHRHGVQP